MKFVRAIVLKPEWKQKMKDSQILAKWKAEVEVYEIREAVLDYAAKELTWLAEAGDPITGIEPTGVDLVWVSALNIRPKHSDLHSS